MFSCRAFEYQRRLQKWQGLWWKQAGEWRGLSGRCPEGWQSGCQKAATGTWWRIRPGSAFFPTHKHSLQVALSNSTSPGKEVRPPRVPNSILKFTSFNCLHRRHGGRMTREKSHERQPQNASSPQSRWPLRWTQQESSVNSIRVQAELRYKWEPTRVSVQPSWCFFQRFFSFSCLAAFSS